MQEDQEIAAHVLQDVLRRLDRAFQNFFRRCKNGENPGYPRFQGRNRFEDIKTGKLTRKPKPKQDEHGTYFPNGATAKGGLNKSILDAGWGTFVQMCAYKAAWAGRTLITVDPRFTSQVCSGCGQVRKKDLSERWHSCDCGTELDRDVNAAINILERGRRQQGAISVEAPCL